MLNYCDVAALQFQVDENYTVLEKDFAHKVTEMVVDEITNERTVKESWTTTSVAAAMDAVTAETLAQYKPILKAGSVMPEGISLYGVLSNENADATLVKMAKATWLYATEVEKSIASLKALEGGASNDNV